MAVGKNLRAAVIGVGGMGSGHCQILADLPGVDLVAVCDIDRERADAMAAKYEATAWYDHLQLLAEAEIDAVTIATPHYAHTPITIHALENNVHVLTEKPLAVHVNDAQLMIDAYEKAHAKNPLLVFGIMFQERTIACNKKIKDLLEGGELGQLTRVTWINTAWFRSQSYYNSGGWRASWAGEGGGILTNQCPHNLDMYQWLFGLPARITGFANLGKFHDIEVEDEVTAYFEHENGMIGHFIVTTGECPGTNRLEVVGENGKLVLENGKLTFYRNRQSMLEFCRNTPTMFEAVENWPTEIPVTAGDPELHKIVLARFLEAVRNEKPLDLVGHGNEGIRGVMLANGIMLSAFLKKTVDVPIDGNAFVANLQKLIANSTYQKKQVENQGVVDFSSSFSK